MFLHTGLQNYVKLEDIEAMASNVYSAPTKRLVKAAEADGRLIDHTEGRKTRSVLFLRSGAVVMTCVETQTLVNRAQAVLNGGIQDIGNEEDEPAEQETVAPAPAPAPAAAPAKGTKAAPAPAAPAKGKAAPAKGGAKGIATDLPE